VKNTAAVSNVSILVISQVAANQHHRDRFLADQILRGIP